MTDNEPGLLRRWYEGVWNERRDDLMERIARHDMVFHGVGAPDQVVRGIDQGFRPLYRKLLGAFPDIRFTVEANIRQGDLEALRWSATMTHAGDHLGMPASNKPVTLTGMTFARIENGKVVEAWDNWDMMGLMNQIGAVERDHVVHPS
jgi:steroid delta-isomerase-like uncharacterized protein